MPLRIVTLAGDAILETELARALGSRDDVDLLFRCVDRVELLASMRSEQIDVIVSVGVPSWLDRETVEEARSRGVLPLGAAPNEMDVVLLERRGVLVVEPDADAIVARASSPDRAPAAPPRMPLGARRGRLLAVWGPKGSPGRTTVAIELAAQSTLRDDATLLVDADPYGGDVAQMLGIVEEVPTVLWAAKLAAKDGLDAGRLALDLRRAGRSGPVLMAGLTRSELWPDISSHAWSRVLDTATSEFSSTVADVGFCLEAGSDLYTGEDGRNRIARSTVEAADRVVAVCRSDPVGIKNFLRGMEQVLEIVGPERVVVVANRVRDRQERQVADLIRGHLGIRPVGYIPDRATQHHKAVMSGASLTEAAPGCDGVAAIRSVAVAVGLISRPSGVLARLASR